MHNRLGELKKARKANHRGRVDERVDNKQKRSSADNRIIQGNYIAKDGMGIPASGGSSAESSFVNGDLAPTEDSKDTLHSHFPTREKRVSFTFEATTLEDTEVAPWEGSGFCRSSTLSLPCSVQSADTLEYPSPLRSSTPSFIEEMEKATLAEKPQHAEKNQNLRRSTPLPARVRSQKGDSSSELGGNSPSELEDDLLAYYEAKAGLHEKISKYVKPMPERNKRAHFMEGFFSKLSLPSVSLSLGQKNKMPFFKKDASQIQKPESTIERQVFVKSSKTTDANENGHGPLRRQIIKLHFGKGVQRSKGSNFITLNVAEAMTIADLELLAKEKLLESFISYKGDSRLDLVHFSSGKRIRGYLSTQSSIALWKLIELAKVVTIQEKGFSSATKRELEAMPRKTRKILEKRLKENVKYGCITVDRIKDRHVESDFITNYKFILNTRS